MPLWRRPHTRQGHLHFVQFVKDDFSPQCHLGVRINRWQNYFRFFIVALLKNANIFIYNSAVTVLVFMGLYGSSFHGSIWFYMVLVFTGLYGSRFTRTIYSRYGSVTVPVWETMSCLLLGERKTPKILNATIESQNRSITSSYIIEQVLYQDKKLQDYMS